VFGVEGALGFGTAAAHLSAGDELQSKEELGRRSEDGMQLDDVLVPQLLHHRHLARQRRRVLLFDPDQELDLDRHRLGARLQLGPHTRGRRGSLRRQQLREADLAELALAEHRAEGEVARL
jgi:hypothetical protein